VNAVLSQKFRTSLVICRSVSLGELGLTDRADPVTEIIARKIIEVAKTGERDPERLCELALKDVRE
jgi:hypothetical protein